MDDGADLVTHAAHQAHRTACQGVIGGTEETTTGVIRLRAMAKDGMLGYPIIAVNDALTKHLFDNRYGTGQCTLDGIIRATNMLLAGLSVVVAGYGWCGRGVAMRAKGQGADVIVTEIDPDARARSRDGRLPRDAHGRSRQDRRHLRHRHRQQVRHRARAFRENEGRRDRLQLRPLQRRDRYPGAREALERQEPARPFVEEFALKDGRKLYVLGEGRLINLAAAEGHPAAVMDMSFANQALSAEYMVKNATELEKQVYSVPEDIDQQIARLKLESMGVQIDKLTPEQEQYLASWSEGT